MVIFCCFCLGGFSLSLLGGTSACLPSIGCIYMILVVDVKKFAFLKGLKCALDLSKVLAEVVL